MPSRARWFAAGGRGAFRPRLRRSWFAELARQRAFNGPGDPRLERALCIVAHPDDVDFFAAALVPGSGENQVDHNAATRHQEDGAGCEEVDVVRMSNNAQCPLEPRVAGTVKGSLPGQLGEPVPP